MVYPKLPKFSHFDPKGAEVSETDWAEATATCHALRVAEVFPETHDTKSIVLEIPDSLQSTFEYTAGQFLSFKIPFKGMVITRSYSLSSSPDTDSEHRVTVKRVDTGRVSNLLNDSLMEGDTLMTTPPSGFFTPTDADRDMVLFGGGSGITPVLSIMKSVLKTSDRSLRLIYANRDERSIIFKSDIESLAARYPGRLEIVHRLDNREGFLDLDTVKQHAEKDADFFLCGPEPFMALVEEGLEAVGAPADQIHIERFVSPTDPDRREAGNDTSADPTPSEIDSVTVVLDKVTHEVPYQDGEKLVDSLRRAGLEAPFSCEEGYCATCMAKLVSGEVRMDINDTLTPALLMEGWVLTCQARCIRGPVRIEYPS